MLGHARELHAVRQSLRAHLLHWPSPGCSLSPATRQSGGPRQAPHYRGTRTHERPRSSRRIDGERHRECDATHDRSPRLTPRNHLTVIGPGFVRSRNRPDRRRLTLDDVQGRRRYGARRSAPRAAIRGRRRRGAWDTDRGLGRGCSPTAHVLPQRLDPTVSRETTERRRTLGSARCDPGSALPRSIRPSSR